MAGLLEHGSRADLDAEVVIDVNAMSEAPRAAIERLASALRVTLLLSLSRLCAERIVGVGDVVLDAVARSLTNPLLPLFVHSRIDGTLAEGSLRPRGGGRAPRARRADHRLRCALA